MNSMNQSKQTIAKTRSRRPSFICSITPSEFSANIANASAMARSRQSSLNVVIVLLDRRKSRIPQLLGSLASARAGTAAHSKLRLRNFGPQRVQTTMLGHSRDTSQSWVFRKVVPGPKSAPEELIVILLLPGSAGVGSLAELPVCGGAFRLADVPAHRKGGRRFLRTVPSSIGRDRESVRFYVQWR